MSRVTYDVVPVESGWLVKTAGNSHSELLPTKTEAVQRARKLGSECDEWRVRVLTASGAVEQELSSAPAATG